VCCLVFRVSCWVVHLVHASVMYYADPVLVRCSSCHCPCAGHVGNGTTCHGLPMSATRHDVLGRCACYWHQASSNTLQCLVTQGSQYQAIHSIPQPTLCSFQALVAGSASSLPSLVLRSMLKQRRILMRMH